MFASKIKQYTEGKKRNMKEKCSMQCFDDGDNNNPDDNGTLNI